MEAELQVAAPTVLSAALASNQPLIADRFSLEEYVFERDNAQDSIVSSAVERGWQRVNRLGNTKVEKVAEMKFHGYYPSHTTAQTFETIEIPDQLFPLLINDLSPLGAAMLRGSLNDAPLAYEELIAKTATMLPMQQSPELRLYVAQLAKSVDEIRTTASLEERQVQVAALREMVRGGIPESNCSYLDALLARVVAYCEQQVVEDFLQVDFKAEFAVNRFARNPNAKIRINPIYCDAMAVGVVGSLIATLPVAGIWYLATNGAPNAFANPINGLLGYAAAGFAMLAGIEYIYQARKDSFISNYTEALFDSQEYKDMLGAVAALEEITTLARLLDDPCASMPLIPEHGEQFSIDQMGDPVYVLKNKSQVFNDFVMDKGVPLTLTGQNGGGKTHTPTAALRNCSVVMIGGPAIGKNAVVPYTTFWAMQSPKQEARGIHGRFGSEADTTGFLLAAAQEHSGRVILVVDEVGGGGDRESTEQATLNTLGEAAGAGMFVIHPTHELPIARKLYRSGLTASYQIEGTGERISNKLIPGVADSSGAWIIVERVGYDAATTRKRVKKSGGDLKLFDRWLAAGRAIKKGETE